MHHNRFDYTPVAKRPVIKWPNNARVALWVIPNIEWHEFDGPGVGTNPPPGFLPDVLNFGWRDYALRAGIWRMMETFDRFGIRGTVALNAAVCENVPNIIEEAKQRNWEFMGHGMTNSQLMAGLSHEDERRVINQVCDTIKQHVGVAPKGWLGPGLAETVNTPDLLAEAGVKYICDWCNDDQPYPFKVKKGTMISVPYSIEINDIPFFVGKGATGKDFADAIQDQFDVLYEEGAKSGKVMAIALHPFLVSVPHRHKHFVRALEYITRHRDVWLTTGGEIADWYYKNYL